MSASLVGSEMCIRDRLCGLQEHANRFLPATRGKSGFEQIAKELHRSAASVSYTHLTLPTICSV
eukprot:9124770-Alexandrium_andersonii.AAC.1